MQPLFAGLCKVYRECNMIFETDNDVFITAFRSRLQQHLKARVLARKNRTTSNSSKTHTREIFKGMQDGNTHNTQQQKSRREHEIILIISPQQPHNRENNNKQ